MKRCGRRDKVVPIVEANVEEDLSAEPFLESGTDFPLGQFPVFLQRQRKGEKKKEVMEEGNLDFDNVSNHSKIFCKKTSHFDYFDRLST